MKVKMIKNLHGVLGASYPCEPCLCQKCVGSCTLCYRDKKLDNCDEQGVMVITCSDFTANSGYRSSGVLGILTMAESVELKVHYLTGSKDFYGTKLYDKLFEYYVFETNEMPYGIAKARTGDPDAWILTQIKKELYPE